MKRGDLILLVLLLGCSPHFQSGKTQCSDRGECPGGFICLNNGTSKLCYDSKTPGCASGGFYCEGLGTCKTSLAACSATGSGGSIGSGGRSGGTGGSGGRTGGAGGTGAGGTSACGAIDPACSSLATDACGTCLAGCCCSQVLSCTGSTSCMNLLSCESSCTTSSCNSGCVSLYPSGETSLNSLLSCTVTNCPTACGSGGSGGTGGSSGGTGGKGGSSGGTGGTGAGGSGASSGTCPRPAAGGTCNVLPSCGCPTGQVCYPSTQATGLKCYPSGGLGEGADCSSGALCAGGFGCFGDVCKRYCQFDSDCPAVDTAQSCDQTYWDSVNMIAGVSVCSRVCDPVNPQNPRSPLLACPLGFGCMSMNTFPGASDCESQSGTGITGTVCVTDDDCSPGYYCSNGGTCIKYCYTVADCPTGLTCISFSTANYTGTTQVNHCHSP